MKTERNNTSKQEIRTSKYALYLPDSEPLTPPRSCNWPESCMCPDCKELRRKHPPLEDNGEPFTWIDVVLHNTQM